MVCCFLFFFFSSRRRHTRCSRDWSSDVCSSDLAKALARRYRVLRYDTRGHGGTEAPAGAYTLSQLAEDARALLRALGIARTHWIGLSMGGMIGQTLALSSPELLQSLSLCDTSSRIPADMKHLWDERIATVEAKGMEPMVEPTVARWFTPKFIETRKDVIEPVRARSEEHTSELQSRLHL